ncbi:TonB-dependent receptor [Alteromonas sp. 345S023]|uniref:TonB-dependent receptor n=1 Tax=Alteromonas profundi TaxID=2696062 RepID=A0A7X5LIN5_9ALTE|nr:TonB-dependent receptor [Alteromonas profundi]
MTTRVQSRPFTQINALASGGTFSYDLSEGLGYSSSAANFYNQADAFTIANVYQSDNTGKSDQLDTELNFVGSYYSEYVNQIRFGVRYSQRDSEVSEPFFGMLNFSASPLLSDFDIGVNEGFYFTNIPALASTLLNGQYLLDSNFDPADTQFASGLKIGSDDSNRLAESSVGEDTTAFYVEGDFVYRNIDINAGVRYVKTDVTAEGAANVDGVVNGVSERNSYHYFLPAINIKYHFTDDLFLRGAYSKALSRPSLAALAPRETFNFTTLEGSRGNPSLDPFRVDQYDIGVEWYFHEQGLIALTYFNKDFSSLVGSERVFLSREVSNETGTSMEEVEFTQPFNTGEGSVDGYELTLQSSLYFLGEEFENFGFTVNYTDLDSEAELTTQNSTQAQPFPNLSPSSYNASLYYDNGVFDAKLSYAWRDGFLQDGLDPEDNFPFQEDYGQLDMTMNYNITSAISLQMQVSNLTDEALEYSSSVVDALSSSIDTERRVLVGVRYKY